MNKYLEAHPVYNFYKAARIFDPRQLPCTTHDIDSFADIKDFQDPSTELVEEFQIYVNYKDDSQNPFTIPAFWNANKSRFPLLQQIANKVIWMPVTRVDVECSFFQYKHLRNKQRENLTLENTKQFTMLYFKGDVEKRFNDC